MLATTHLLNWTHTHTHTYCPRFACPLSAWVVAAPFIFDTKYESLNHPKLVRAHIEYAAKIARKRGVTEQVDAFDQAAAGFEKPTPLVAAT